MASSTTTHTTCNKGFGLYSCIELPESWTLMDILLAWTILSVIELPERVLCSNKKKPANFTFTWCVCIKKVSPKIHKKEFPRMKYQQSESADKPNRQLNVLKQQATVPGKAWRGPLSPSITRATQKPGGQILFLTKKTPVDTIQPRRAAEHNNTDSSFWVNEAKSVKAAQRLEFCRQTTREHMDQLPDAPSGDLGGGGVKCSPPPGGERGVWAGELAQTAAERPTLRFHVFVNTDIHQINWPLTVNTRIYSVTSHEMEMIFNQTLKRKIWAFLCPLKKTKWGRGSLWKQTHGPLPGPGMKRRALQQTQVVHLVADAACLSTGITPSYSSASHHCLPN